jgi:hypothetical protein
LLEVEAETYLARVSCFFFAKKWDHFLGGMPPAVAPEGNFGFRGKPSCPFYYADDVYMVVTNWGAGYVILQQNTWKS